MMKTLNQITFGLLLSGAFFGTGQALADQSDCVRALIQDKGYFSLREASSLAQFRLLEQSSSSESDLSANAEIPEIISVGFGSAKSRTKSFFENSSLNWTQERIVSVATQTLSKNAVEAYKACVYGRHDIGPRIFVHDATEEEATVLIHWKPGPGQNEAEDLKISLTGGKLKAPFIKSLEPGTEDSAIVIRESGKDFRITATIGGRSDAAFVSRWPVEETQEKLLSERIEDGETFLFTLSNGPDESGNCGQSWQDPNNFMGNAMGQEIYSLKYDAAGNSWTISGKNQGNCQTYGRPHNIPVALPQDYKINFWGRLIGFDETGALIDGQYGVVGSIDVK